MTDSIVLVGAGGHCKAVIDVAESAGCSIFGILDMKADGDVLGYPVIGTDERIAELAASHLFHITVGQIKSAAIRKKLFEQLLNAGASVATIISSSAQISSHSKIGDGTTVMHGALVNAAVTIGENCIINNKALIEHDSIVGNHTHISTGAIINGGCVIGSGVFIGSGSVIANGVTIADDCVIGAGAVVVKSITERGTYVGSPAKRIDA